MIARQYSTLRPLLIAAIALVALPLAMRVIGLTTDTASTVVILAIAAMGLNLCVGYAGLVSFGHAAWFGIGAYAAALIQREWFPNEIALPILLSMVIVAALSTFAGSLILRRRGVYFSLLTLALAALTYTISFRWTDVTGGENGLGDLKRGNIGPISLDIRSLTTPWSPWSHSGCFTSCNVCCVHRLGMWWWRSAKISCAPRFRAIRSSAISSSHSCSRQRSPAWLARCSGF